MDCNFDLGQFSSANFRAASEWIISHSEGKERLIVALQFSNSDVVYAPRIQYLIENQVKSMLSKDDSTADECKIRFFILCDVLNPACCLDILNVKKSHSDLVIHFGYSCYRNTEQFRQPVYYIPSSLNYFDDSEPSVIRETVSFVHGQLKQKLNTQDSSSERTNLILSFQGILNKDSQSALENEITNLVNTFDHDICVYQISPITTTDFLKSNDFEFICDLPLKKIGHDRELHLEDFENKFLEATSSPTTNSPIIFFHIISKNQDYSTLSNSFIERIILRYNQIFDISLCQVSSSNSSIELNKHELDRLSSIISKRFVSIENAKSISSINRVAFIITPGVTPLEWKLIQIFKKYKYRENTDDGSKVPIETHIISLAGVSEVKLRNFPDIDIFCYFGCSEYFLSHIIKTLNLKNPIILTPFEYQVFLGIREWSTCYLNVNDLQEFATNNQCKPPSDTASESDDSELDQSFSKLAIEGSKASNNNTLSTKSDSHSLQNLDRRAKKLLVRLDTIKNKHANTYFGLDPLENTEQIPTITRGKDGIASVYANECK
ncbi:hypothetical protein OIY81_1089 [Cryptosporidium canis]|nr:hypothetical protein OIY81_1089 [Cryptosporidium canis]